MQREDFEERYTDAQCDDLFASLFPNGFSGEDVLAEIAPEGWERSTLHFVFHPTVDQVHWESVQLHRNLRQWPWRPVEVQLEPEPTFEEIRSAYQDAPLDEKRELRELVGMCLWDVFSNEHEVSDRKGRLVELGSWRGSGDFLAEQLNRECGLSQYSYMDFYMGTIGVSGRADLTPVYEMIFRRLKALSMDWHYRFPELHLIDLCPEERDDEEQYELDKMRANLKQAHREAVEDAKLEPVPEIVAAYKNIYSDFPQVWPPWRFDYQND